MISGKMVHFCLRRLPTKYFMVNINYRYKHIQEPVFEMLYIIVHISHLLNKFVFVIFLPWKNIVVFQSY